MSWGATKATVGALGYGGRQVKNFAKQQQGPVEAMGGAALALGAAAAFVPAVAMDLLDKPATALGNRVMNTDSDTFKEFAKRAAKATPDAVVGSAKFTGKKLESAHRTFSGPLDKAADKLETRLLKTWEPQYGARKLLGGSLGLGAAFGMATSAFQFNREITDEAMAKAEEGSAYESGPGAFGSGSGKRMPTANGRMTLGMHKRRHG